MGYTPNNPLVPGDPYSYDLRWLVEKVKYVDKEIDDFVAYNKLHFEGSWDGNKTYTAWAIVQDANGDGYLSIQAVPQNVNLNNTDYWQLIADYSALYTAFDARLTDAENDIISLQGDVSTLQSDVLALQHRVQDNVYLLISDSYGSDDPDNDRVAWMTYFTSILGLTPGDNMFRYHKSGAGFAHNGGQPGSLEGKNFCDVLNTAIGAMTADERDSVTKIIIAGGVNDWDGTDADTQTGIENFDSIARTNYPNADIILVACGWAKRADIRYASTQRYKVYYDIGSGLAWTVDNTAFQALQDKRLFIADGVHPTATGSKVITCEIINLLGGSSGQAQHPAPVAITISGTQHGRAMLSGNNVIINLANFSPGAIPDLASNASVDVAEIDCPYIFGGGTVSEEFLAALNMKISGTWQAKMVSCFFRYDSGLDKTYLCVHNNAEFDGSNYGSYSSIQDTYLCIGKVTLAPYC